MLDEKYRNLNILTKSILSKSSLTTQISKIAVSKDYFTNTNENPEIIIVTKEPLSTESSTSLSLSLSMRYRDFVFSIVSLASYNNDGYNSETLILHE